MEREYKYDAFISYRHLNPDKDIADKLQRMLESYTPPKALRGEGKWKKWHIFRDETELPTSSNLGDDIKNALDNSNFLIVICSPKTSESRWCMEEIEYFKKIHNGNNAKIITVVASGTPEEAFPDELCKELVEVMDDEGNATYEERIIEPLAANVASENTKDAIKKLKEEFLRVVAPMLGCGYDDLYNREQKKKTKRIIISSLCAIFAFALFSIYNGIMLYRINLKNQELEEANYNLQVEKSEVSLAQAETMLDLGNNYEAVKYAYEAIPKGGAEYPAVNKAERILAKGLGVYSTDGKVQCATTVKISDGVYSLASTEDGSRLIVRDNAANVYLIDTNKKEIIKTFTEHETFHTTSRGINAIIVSGNTFYMMDSDNNLDNNTLVSVNAEGGSENWRCKTIFLGKLVTNDLVDFICVVGNKEYCFIDKKSGKVINDGAFSEFVNGDYYYMSSDGTVYIIEDDYNIKSNEMHIISKDSYKQERLGLGTEYNVLSMGECEDCIYINVGKGSANKFNEEELICIEKENNKIRWRNDYTVKDVSEYECHKIFPLKHKIKKSKTDDTMMEMDGIAVVADHIIIMFDKETGSGYTGTMLGGDIALYTDKGGSHILACDKNGETSDIKMITNGMFFERLSFSNCESFGAGDFLGYYLPKGGIDYAAFLRTGYAFSDYGSTEVKIVDYVECDNFTEVPGFATNNTVWKIKDSKNGIIVVEERVYSNGEENNLITIYDGEKITGKVKLPDFNVRDILIFDDRVVIAGYEEIILCDLKGNILDEAVLEEKIKAFIGDEQLVSWDISSVAIAGKEIFITTYKEDVVIDISGDMIDIKDVNTYSSIGKVYASGKSIEFVAQYDEENEKFCKIANISASGTSFVKKDGADYVFTNDKKDTDAHNLITCVTYSNEAKMAAFSDVSGFIGIYRDGEESFSEIKYDPLKYTVNSMAFSNDGKYLFAIMKGGRIVKYSVESLSVVSENEIDIAGNMNLKELCENTLILSESSYNHKVISEETLEIRAEISGDISWDGSKFYNYISDGDIYKIGYNKYLTREELLLKAEEFLTK